VGAVVAGGGVDGIGASVDTGATGDGVVAGSSVGEVRMMVGTVTGGMVVTGATVVGVTGLGIVVVGLGLGTPLP